MKYSVWYIPYSKRYLITHPWVWCKYAWKCVKDAWRRSVYGWTYSDVWDWDDWFLSVVPAMLRFLAEKGCAYPAYPPFETREKWEKWLVQMADLLDSGSEEWKDEHNEWYKPFKEARCTADSPEKRELMERWIARSKELDKQGEENIKKALGEIAEHFYAMWD